MYRSFGEIFVACNEIPLIIIFSQATIAFNSNILYLFLQFLNLSCSILEKDYFIEN